MVILRPSLSALHSSRAEVIAFFGAPNSVPKLPTPLRPRTLRISLCWRVTRVGEVLDSMQRFPSGDSLYESPTIRFWYT
jgi:hypothetical protein